MSEARTYQVLEEQKMHILHPSPGPTSQLKILPVTSVANLYLGRKIIKVSYTTKVDHTKTGRHAYMQAHTQTNFLPTDLLLCVLHLQ